ncbi:MAG: DUF2334 domain-containing protein [Candidatus Omnitrophica bacterium]|nr:DUF2334 domain-containing protein [Candidatus Omnitrophota bacterium]
MTARLFIRNDDVWTLDKEFKFLFNLAQYRHVPVIHAVIPGKMDRSLVKFLNKAKEQMPQLLDIVQHGWLHANHSVSKDMKYEFGKGRLLSVQRQDMAQGLKKMRADFGDHFTPAFVPPYHGYDKNTLKLVEEQGFKVFSAKSRRFSGDYKLMNLPAEVSFSSYKQGKMTFYKAMDVVRMLVKNAQQKPFTGIVLHHKHFSTEKRRQELVKFFDYIVSLRDTKGWQIILFSDFLNEIHYDH